MFGKKKIEQLESDVKALRERLDWEVIDKAQYKVGEIVRYSIYSPSPFGHGVGSEHTYVSVIARVKVLENGGLKYVMESGMEAYPGRMIERCDCAPKKKGKKK